MPTGASITRSWNDERVYRCTAPRMQGNSAIVLRTSSKCFLPAQGSSRRFLLIRIRHPIVHPMIDPTHVNAAEAEKVAEVVSFPFRPEGSRRIRHASDLTAPAGTKSLFHIFKAPRLAAVSGLVATESSVDVAPVALTSPTRGRKWREELFKQSMVAAWVVLCVCALGACNNPADCSGGEYRGGCLAGSQGSPVVNPAIVNSPSPAPYAAPANAGVNPAPVTVRHGDPSEFADVDDRQCRSYGLTFGTRDYADCRIRLSAQHRGLDPNIGATSPGAGSR
jgi:hypothetical protein